MNQYDHTKNMRQLFWRIDVAPFCGILVCLLFLFMAGNDCLCCRSRFVNIPYAENAGVQSEPGFPTIYIKKDGTVFFLESHVEKLDALPGLVKEEVRIRNYEGNKFLIKADKAARFGKVQEVLRVAKKSGLEVAGLITEGRFAPMHFFKAKNTGNNHGS